MTAVRSPRCGDIGEPQRHIEFEPMPATEPVHEPSPAPAQPEKVPASVLMRFVAKVGSAEPGSTCRHWQASVDRNGYGRFKLNGRMALAHRVAYQFFIGPVPAGACLDHLCRNRSCVNPLHLEPVSGSENTLRGGGPTAQNAARTQCINGHPFDESNTYTQGGRRRQCRTCNAAAVRRLAERKRLAGAA